ncbi:MAG TPA: quinone-dependent dihydroorotate dehydrogenase [Candidatus Binataceae bacterium]|nr:quinone-dependent dihydroorotate dehydrogenase [Candidatus Binataceae bacterium]
MSDLLGSSYRRILRPLFFRLDPETSHRLTLGLLARLLRFKPAIDPPELRTEVFGLYFSNPIGLSAGMDKDVRAPLAWNSLGFGFAEFGTITPRPQPGNEKPRMWRLPAHRAVINRLGFPGEGLAIVAPRIEQLRHQQMRLRVGINVGPNKDTPPEKVADDYATLMGRVAPIADFVVINVSSPNTPGLRTFQTPERIRAIVEAMRAVASVAARPVPILLKIAPDLDSTAVEEISEAALSLKLDGIVATNTTLQRDAVGVRSELAGGLSGEPLKELARAMIARLYGHLRGRITIIGVGGVSSAEDAYEHIRAGANLVEMYTSLIYHGPSLVREIKRGLMRLLARDGFRSISEAVGSALHT